MSSSRSCKDNEVNLITYWNLGSLIKIFLLTTLLCIIVWDLYNYETGYFSQFRNLIRSQHFREKSTARKTRKLYPIDMNNTSESDESITDTRTASKIPLEYRAFNMSRLLDDQRLCGEYDHSQLTRPCESDDKNCGEWKGRHWIPTNCRYRDITPAQARSCLGKRTLAFIGDGTLRDIGFGVARFLLGEDLDSSPDTDVNTNGSISKLSVIIPSVDDWMLNVNTQFYKENGYVFPRPETKREFKHKWQVQIWMLFRNDYLQGQVDHVLNNQMTSKFDYLQRIDLAFWSHGLHDHGWYSVPPHGTKFFNQVLRIWKDLRKKVLVPSIWVSLNPECKEKLKWFITMNNKQADMIEDVNTFNNVRCLKSKLPYWDAGAVLRTSNRCHLTNDGFHVKMYVDTMRAKMLFNHLCDKDMNWRGSDNIFK